MAEEEKEIPQETGRTATQRGSLKQVNATLLAQTEVLRDTQTSILSTNNLLTKSLQGQLQAAQLAKLKKAEADREGGRFRQVAGGIAAGGRAAAGAVQSGIGNLQGLFNKMGAFLTPAALAALPSILAGTLIRRGIPALAVGVFADEISNFLLGDEVSQEMRNQVTQAIQGGALGSLLGKKFALIGAAAGFLIDEDVQAQLLELAKGFGALIGNDIDSLEDLKAVMMSIGEFIRTNLKSGLQGINELLRGDIAGFLGIGEGNESNLISTLGLLGALGLVFAPGSTLRLALAAPNLLLWTGGKVLGALKAIGGLGMAITAASTASAATTAAGAAASTVAGAGKGGALMKIAGGALTIPGIGPIIAIGAVTAAAAVAFTQTQLYADLKKKSEEILASMPLGFDTDESAIMSPGDRSPANQSVSNDDALRETYLNTMAATEPGSKTYELAAKALARLDAKRAASNRQAAVPDFVKAIPPSTASAVRESTMAMPISKPVFVDNSTRGGDQNISNNQSVIGAGLTSYDKKDPAMHHPFDIRRGLVPGLN